MGGALPGAAAREELLFDGIRKADEFSLKVHRCRSGKQAQEAADAVDYLGYAEFTVAEAHLGEEVEYPLKNRDRIVGDVSLRLMAEFQKSEPCRSKGDRIEGGAGD